MRDEDENLPRAEAREQWREAAVAVPSSQRLVVILTVTCAVSHLFFLSQSSSFRLSRENGPAAAAIGSTSPTKHSKPAVSVGGW